MENGFNDKEGPSSKALSALGNAAVPQPVIAATGIYTPPYSISNAELVGAFNAYVERFNADNADGHRGRRGRAADCPLPSSSSRRPPGIKSRYVMDKPGILDPAVMRPTSPSGRTRKSRSWPRWPSRRPRRRIEHWGGSRRRHRRGDLRGSNMQRAYPAMAVEVQDALGIGGFAFDMNVACSSATFGIKTAADFIASGSVKAVLMVNPEICSGHLNFRDRDSHFIFGDVATAVIVESDAELATDGWDILGTRLKTKFSNNIRNNFGFLNRAAPEGIGGKRQALRAGGPQGLQGGRADGRRELIVEHAARPRRSTRER